MDHYEDVVNAISFIEWRTVNDIVDRTQLSKPEIRKILKKLIKDGDLEKKKDKYRYPNALQDN